MADFSGVNDDVNDDWDRWRAIVIVSLVELDFATRDPDGQTVSVTPGGDSVVRAFEKDSSRLTRAGRLKRKIFDSLLRELRDTGKLRMPVEAPFDKFARADSLSEFAAADRAETEQAEREFERRMREHEQNIRESKEKLHELQVFLTVRSQAASVIEDFISSAYEKASEEERMAIPADAAWAICAHAVVSEAGMMNPGLESAFRELLATPSASNRKVCEAELESVFGIEPVLRQLIEELHEEYFSRDA